MNEKISLCIGASRPRALNTEICGLTRRRHSHTLAIIMEALAQEIATLPPDVVDRQRLLSMLGNAERNRAIQKNKEASKWVIQVGAALHKVGGDALPVAVRVFEHAVHLSKQLDNGAPNYMRAEFDANNTELGDAYTWLGATEAAIGKTVEAEASYKAAARAVEDRGVVEFCDKLLHQAIFFRNRKMREKYDATLKRWETALRAAGGGDCPEGDVALLQATVSLLQEKCQGLTHGTIDDGPNLAAELRAKKLAEAVLRLEAHPLRPKGSLPLKDVYQLTAMSYDRLKNKQMALFFFSRSVAAAAGSLRFAGLSPIGELKREVEGEDTVSWTEDLIGRWGGPGEGGGPPEGPPAEKELRMHRAEQAAFNHILQIGDKWRMRAGKPGGPHPMSGAEEVGNQCYALGQQMFGVGAWRECQRPLRVTAALMMHMPFHQGAACHLLACAYFHENAQFHGGKNEKLLAFAAGAFQASAAARLSLGPENTRAIKEAIGSLLFLARVLMEMRNWKDAERVNVQALELSRESLDDKSEETQQCLKSIMTLRAKMKEAADGGGGGGGGK